MNNQTTSVRTNVPRGTLRFPKLATWELRDAIVELMEAKTYGMTTEDFNTHENLINDMRLEIQRRNLGGK